MRWSVSSRPASSAAAPPDSSAAATCATRAAAVLSIPDNIERYSTAASIAPAAVSATNTTVAATSAERADIPQLHRRRRRIGISPPFTPEIRHVYRTMCAVRDIVAIVFMVTTIRDEVRALREALAEQHDPARLLADTPLRIEPGHQPVRSSLSLAERINVVAVMVVSQAIQVVFFTAGLFA